MNTKEKLESMLYECGMFEEQAKAVVDLAIPELEKQLPDYHITWDRPHDEYPEVMYNLWFVSIKPIALKWTEENCPNAWYKAMFM